MKTVDPNAPEIESDIEPCEFCGAPSTVLCAIFRECDVPACEKCLFRESTINELVVTSPADDSVEVGIGKTRIARTDRPHGSSSAKIHPASDSMDVTPIETAGPASPATTCAPSRGSSPIQRKSGPSTAAIYVPVSPRDQDQDTQIFELREYALRKGWEVVEYRETNTRARIFGRMMNDAWGHKFDAVLVQSLDCFACSLADLRIYGKT